MPLHPQVETILRNAPRDWFDLDSMTVAKARALHVEGVAKASPGLPPGVAIEDVALLGAEEPLGGRVHRPSKSPPVGTVLWIRGGGFVTGTLEADLIPAPLALASGCTVVSVEYRLWRPSTRFGLGSRTATRRCAGLQTTPRHLAATTVPSRWGARAQAAILPLRSR